MSPVDFVGMAWPALADRVELTGSLRRWAEAEPALAGVGSLPELAELVQAGGDRSDVLLGALLRLAAVDGAGDELAASVVAHLLAPGSGRIAASVSDFGAGVDALVAAELWIRIRTFPWRRRRRAFARNVLLDTRRAVLAELLPYRDREGARRVTLVDPTGGVGARVATARDLVETEALGGPGTDLSDLLRWALQAGRIDRADAALLSDLVAAADRFDDGTRTPRGLFASAEENQVAAERGVHRHTVRRHRDRVLASLREASADYLAAVA